MARSSTTFQKGHKINLGKHYSKEWRKHISKGLKGRKLSEEHRKKVIKNLIPGQKGMLGKHISEETRKKLSLCRKKEKHWNWKGGITLENATIRNSLEYEIWRNEVWKRDRWECRLCKSKKQLVAHHLKLFSDFPELRFDVNNGITLCRSCHAKIHKRTKRIC